MMHDLTDPDKLPLTHDIIIPGFLREVFEQHHVGTLVH
jgi:hypothetical protein